MARVLFNVSAYGNEKSIPVDVLVSKKIKNVKINFDENSVEVSYEEEKANNSEDNSGASGSVDSEEVVDGEDSEQQTSLKENHSEPNHKTATVQMSGAGNDPTEVKPPTEDEQKQMAKLANSDTGGNESTVEGAARGTKKVNTVSASVKKSGDKTT